MQDHRRCTVKIGGESGQGINVAGEVIGKAVKRLGYHVFAYREYPSLIQGGFSSYQVNFADYPVGSAAKLSDLVVCISRASTHAYLPTVSKNGVLVHTIHKFELTNEEQSYVNENNIKVVFVDAWKMIFELKASAVVINMIMLGVIWKLLDLDVGTLSEVVKQEFKDKPEFIDKDLQAIMAGYRYDLPQESKFNLQLQPGDSRQDSLLMTGNHSLALGAISAGVRAYIGYPMTPASSIQSYLANTYKETGIVMKQAEDEITAIEMVIGAMHMGTRAFVATSGGGFDLMTESISLAGMTETPVVCVVAQRPGPATGVPTWTANSDLNIAVYGAHGEFPRAVLAASDAVSAYQLIQKAFNLAEKYQTPVIVLTDKHIAESLFNIDRLPEAVTIERGLVPENQLPHLQSHDRYQLTDSGISARWLPGQSEAVYIANSDEHLADGTLTEDGESAKAMVDKRMRKQDTMLAELPEPELFGPEHAQITFIGWGSVKGTMLDAIQILEHLNSETKVNYLHFDYVYPLRTDKLNQLTAGNKRVALIENNKTGQLGNLIRQTTGYAFKEKLLKYDGRPFFIEEILDYLRI